jgi:hypothetical protein
LWKGSLWCGAIRKLLHTREALVRSCHLALHVKTKAHTEPIFENSEKPHFRIGALETENFCSVSVVAGAKKGEKIDRTQKAFWGTVGQSGGNGYANFVEFCVCEERCVRFAEHL